MPSFTWTPDFEASNSPTINVIEHKFGDGYSQRQTVGINPRKSIWSLTFNKRNLTEGMAIKNFLDARLGVQAFDFIPPGEVDPIKVVCKTGQWSYRIIAGMNMNVSAKFEEVFEP